MSYAFRDLNDVVIVKPLHIRFTNSIEGGLLIAVLQEQLRDKQRLEGLVSGDLWVKVKFSSLEKKYGLKRPRVLKLCRKWMKLGFLDMVVHSDQFSDDELEYRFRSSIFTDLLVDFLKEEESQQEGRSI
jgi:hypothetical protein